MKSALILQGWYQKPESYTQLVSWYKNLDGLGNFGSEQQITALAIEKGEDPAPDAIAMTVLVLTKDFEGIENNDLLIPIARSTLMALKIPTSLMKSIVKVYGDILNG